MKEPWERNSGYSYYPKDIEEAQKQIFDSAELTKEYSIEDIRKMPIWTAGIWKDYYVVQAGTEGGASIDEWGIYPDDVKSFFINRKDGSIRIATVSRAAPYFIESARKMMPTKAMDTVPYDNLKIG